jgi:acyl-lipid omega-6 desaturase (Delta-12 desaturase)
MSFARVANLLLIWDCFERVLDVWGELLTVNSVNWAQKLAPYRATKNGRAIFEVALTLTLFAAIWYLTYQLSFISIFAEMAAALLAGGFLVRLFMLQHDCGHLALFPSKRVNDTVGRLLGVLTLTPYDYWRHAHAMHHAGSGNLDKRGVGDIKTMTLSEYRDAGMMGRFGYRLYRNPIVMFVVGPIYLFIFQQRMPPGAFRQGTASWVSVFLTNIGIVAFVAALCYFFGWQAVLLVHLPIVFFAGAIGVWLFYVQHQFDPTHWEPNAHWNAHQAALEGSSYYDLPKPLMWLTGNIGIHHLHHLASRIPFYKLPQVLKDFPELDEVATRLTFWESLGCINLSVWDERKKELISFRRAHEALRLEPKAA